MTTINAGNYFRMTLTGAADATTDVVLPVSSINARLRSGSDSYLQVVIPCTADYAAAIADRPSGDLLLQYISLDSAGVETVTTVVTVDFETVQQSTGIRNRSINLTGHRQTTNAAPGSHTLYASSLQVGTTKKTAIVPGYDPAVLPADSITVDGVTYVVDVVSLQASISSGGGVNILTQYVEG